MQCSIPSSVLNSAPYSIQWGLNITVQIRAINNYGASTYSVSGFGGAIITIPDAPISIVEVIQLRTLNAISFTWQQGSSNGGSSIIDYNIYYD